MTRTHLLPATLLILIVLSSCASPETDRSDSDVRQDPRGASTGITVFGDARIGATFGR